MKFVLHRNEFWVRLYLEGIPQANRNGRNVGGSTTENILTWSVKVSAALASVLWPREASMSYRFF